MSKNLIVDSSRNIERLKSEHGQVPDAIIRDGLATSRAWDDFFDSKYPNANTRRAYRSAVRQFLKWCDEEPAIRSGGLAAVTAGQCGRYLASKACSDYSKKIHRTANKQFFDLLVERHICLVNPWASAKAPRVDRRRGKTPRIKPHQIGHLLESIDRSTPAGMRDHTIIAILAGCGVRAHAISKLSVSDYLGVKGDRSLFFGEKGGKEYTVPLRGDVEKWFEDYLTYFGLYNAPGDSPIFRPFVRQTGSFAPLPSTGPPGQGRLQPNDVCRMVKRRMKKARLPRELSAHSFRVNMVTALREVRVPINEIQQLAGHADPRTTAIYDRSDEPVKRRTVELIAIDGEKSLRGES